MEETQTKQPLDLGKTLGSVRPEDVAKATEAYYIGQIQFFKKILANPRVKRLLRIGLIILLVFFALWVVAAVIALKEFRSTQQEIENQASQIRQKSASFPPLR